MRFLFIHQNFPGQFRHVAKALADAPENEVVAVGEARNLRDRPPLHPRVKLFAYEAHGCGGKDTHHYIRDYEGHIRRGQSIARLLITLRDEKGFRPDVVVAHPGWGEGLFLKDIFPAARHIQYFEYFYQGQGGDVGFDAEFPCTLDDQLRVRIKNSTQLHSLVACDEGLSPTAWQKSRFPAEFQSKIEVIHEGIDTRVVHPDPAALVTVNGETYRAGEEIVTYVARNLEPYRGIHTFLRALPHLQALRPNARVVLVGGDDVSYGKRLPAGQSYRQRYCDELKDRVDWQRVRFLGKLPYGDYLKILQISAAHVYLTYPFVLSWSMLEAMSAGCLLIASATPPVEEVIEDGRNGRLVDFFDANALAETIAQTLATPDTSKLMRAAARATVVERYDLTTRCLPQTLAFLQRR